MAHPYLVMRYRLDGVITVVDAVNGAATLDESIESVKQVAVADRIVLTKTDLIDTPERRQAKDRLLARLHALNPAAPVLDAAANEATAGRLLACGLFDPERKIPDVKCWLAEEAYAQPHAPVTITTISTTRTGTTSDPRLTLATEMPIPAATFECSSISCARCTARSCWPQGHRAIAEDPGRPLVIHGGAARHASGGAARALARRDHRTRSCSSPATSSRSPSAAVRRICQPHCTRRPDRGSPRDNPLIPFGASIAEAEPLLNHSLDHSCHHMPTARCCHGAPAVSRVPRVSARIAMEMTSGLTADVNFA